MTGVRGRLWRNVSETSWKRDCLRPTQPISRALGGSAFTSVMSFPRRSSLGAVWRSTLRIGTALDFLPASRMALRRALRADISDEAWESINSTVSRPFPRPKTGKVAVKVINHYGDEVMRVYVLPA
jgi:hypothetical protein